DTGAVARSRRAGGHELDVIGQGIGGGIADAVGAGDDLDELLVDVDPLDVAGRAAVTSLGNAGAGLADVQRQVDGRVGHLGHEAVVGEAPGPHVHAHLAAQVQRGVGDA